MTDFMEFMIQYTDAVPTYKLYTRRSGKVMNNSEYDSQHSTETWGLDSDTHLMQIQKYFVTRCHECKGRLLLNKYFVVMRLFVSS